MAYAEGSRRNLNTQWESFLLFCTYFKFCPLPADTETLQLYAQFLSRSFKSVESIKNYISGVKIMHLLLGAKIEHINNFLLNLSLKGMSKTKLHMVRQAHPMTTNLLLKIYRVLDLSSPDDNTFWCLFLFAFFLLARKSNLVPTTKKELLNPKFLLSKDVRVTSTGLLITMKWTKTIQKGERLLVVPLTCINGSPLCPVKAYHRMIGYIPRSMSCPLFILNSGKPVFYNTYLKKLRSVIEMIGLDPSHFSTHSFRRGMATLAFQLNLPADIIQLLGDWKSDAYKKYLYFSLTDKLRLSKYISDKIQSEGYEHGNL
ncbi:uncharacterized protein LOC128549996 [Mercenaria mercenaria]|uniref:uncharacterized protein LOC128549996 n=1 Tax=Mercenaria mercenaria TaxID=6596 RepID=UPI00234ED2C1|nr:uncharacterized protein LOC128549996 [Mercenaria mercenaria]